MAKPTITIVGLGLIGNSIGLALSQGKRDFEIVGHDRDHNAAGQAKKMGAVDKTEWNLINACEKADLVILALPVNGIRDTLRALAGELKVGCVVMDTATIKTPVLQWADELLGGSVHFVGTNPIVTADASGGAAARADLFENATWAICSTPKTDAAAVKTAADLADRIGARPLFLDPVEHDGMLAAVDHLPALVGAVLVESLAAQPSWREMRKLAGGQFESSTRLASADPQVSADMTLANTVNLARWIDILVDALQAWQDRIEAGDEEGVQELFAKAVSLRRRWDSERETGRWDEGMPEMPEKTGMLSQMFGLGAFRSRSREQDEGSSR